MNNRKHRYGKDSTLTQIAANIIIKKGIYQIIEKQVRTTKNGDPFFFLTLSNKNGKMKAIRFIGQLDEFENLNSVYLEGNILQIEGKYSNEFKNIKISYEKLLNINEYRQSEFIKPTELNVLKIIEVIKDAIGSIRRPYYRQLLSSIFSEQEMRRRYFICPASKNHHHACTYGHSHHVANMLKNEKIKALSYSNNSYLDRDLLMMGILLHDIGKTEYYSINNGIPIISKKAKTIDHVALGIQIIVKNIEKVEDFLEVDKNKLVHMIISHHGSKKWGAYVEPKFPEAKILHYLDLLDSDYNFYSNNYEPEFIRNNIGKMKLKEKE